MEPEGHSPQVERTARRLYRMRMVIVVLAFAIICLTATIVSYNSWQQSKAQQQLLAITQNEIDNADKIKTLVERITECTTPGKLCYDDDGGKAQAAATSRLTRMMTAANVCAARLDLRHGPLQSAVLRMLACIRAVLVLLPR